jgi:hypothetical protein
MQATFEALSPVAEPLSRNISPAAPLAELEGKKIGFMWTIYTNGDLLADALGDLLRKRFKGLQTVKLPAGKAQRWGEYPDHSIDEVVKDAGVDAVVVTVGG